MATYEVTAPDGKQYEITAPDDATEDQVMEYAKANYGKKAEKPAFQQRIDQMPSFMRALYGGGEAALQAGSGLGATVLGGLGGLGNLALGGKDPASTIRGVQEAMTYQPRTEQGQLASKVLMAPGELYSKGVHWVGDKARGDDSGGVRDLLATTLEVGAEAAPAVLGGVSALKTARRSMPMSRTQETLAAAQREGYVVPPSQAGRSSVLEGIGGKIRTAQTASARNAEVTNKLAARELGLPDGTAITVQRLEQMRRDAYKTGYEPIKQVKQPIAADLQYVDDLLKLSKEADDFRMGFPNAKLAGADKISDLVNGLFEQKFPAASAVDMIKKLRSEANKNLQWSATPAPEAVALGRAQKAAASAIESLVERNLSASGNTNMVAAFRDARTKIAKTHSVENALNDATGNVSARALAKGKDAGALTGDLKTAAQFGEAFPKANQMPELFGGTPPLSPLDVSVGAGAAIGGQIATGNPMGALYGGVPLLRPLAAPLALRNQASLVRNRPSLSQYGVLPFASPLLSLGNEQDQGLLGRR